MNWKRYNKNLSSRARIHKVGSGGSGGGCLFLSDGSAVAATLFIRAHTQAAFIAAYSSLAIDTSARVNGGRGVRLRLFQTHAADNERERRAREGEPKSEYRQPFECNARLKYLLKNNPGPFHFIRTRAAVSASHFSRARQPFRF